MSSSSAPKVTFDGLGLHSGERCTATVRRAAPGQGISLVRLDHPGSAPIEATHHAVLSTDHHTVLGDHRTRVSVATTEHILAALSGLGHWDALIGVTGPELPILDGSAQELVGALSSWKRREPPRAIILAEPVEVVIGSSRAVASPSDRFSICCTIDFPHPSIGTQEFSWEGSPETFRRDLAPARTFGFLDDVDHLRQRGLAMGGSLDNALVFGPEGPVNEPRFSDEPARHKLLDALGDLALLGRPLRASIRLERPGHTLLVELVREIERIRDGVK